MAIRYRKSPPAILSLIGVLLIGCGPSPLMGDWEGEWDVDGVRFDVELEVADPADGYQNVRGELSLSGDSWELSGSMNDRRKRKGEEYELNEWMECDRETCSLLSVEGGGSLWINADFSDDMDEIEGEGVLVEYGIGDEEDIVLDGDIELERD